MSDENFNPTAELRWLKRTSDGGFVDMTLQQKHVSDTGLELWRNVPVVDERGA